MPETNQPLDSQNSQDVAGRWRVTLADKIGPIYAAIPSVQAVVLIGGVARARDDRYSDIDMTCFWDRSPTDAERCDAMRQIGALLNTPLVLGRFVSYPAGAQPESTLLWEDYGYIGGDEAGGFQIDVNHRPIWVMERIFVDVIEQLDIEGWKLETLYSIRYVRCLHGEPLIKRWQARAAVYPDELARKLVTLHLSELNGNAVVHAVRGDLLTFYQVMTTTQHHLTGALLALNRIYRPELKRLRYLCDEMKIKPDDFAARINRMLLTEPEQAAHDLDALAEEVFALVETHLPGVNVARLRRDFRARRQPYDTSPVPL